MKSKRKIIYMLLLTFLLGFITKSYSVSASDDVNIISNTNVTVQTAKEWAKERGATETFINLADLYYKYSKDDANVNPALAYVQAAKETGYGKFGGVIDASYYNPCGLKTKEGGSNTDPNAHQRFANWDEGVQAQLDHLALYAGANGYPRTSTYDSRHFSYLFGTARTVKALDSKWADATYGDEVMNLYKDIEDKQSQISNVQPPKDDLSVCIDSTKYYTGDRLQLSGWILSKGTIKNVDVYIDGILKGSFGPNINREDVFNNYPEYNQHNSGFNFVCNISDIANGTKSLKLIATTTDGQSFARDTNINIQKPQGLLIALDPGHCYGVDDGAYATVNGVKYSETALNLEIALKARERLQNAGFSIIMTRENNNQLASTTTDSLQRRCDIANNSNAALFISIHQNSFNSSTSGTEGFYYETNTKAKQLVTEITKNISNILGNNNRGPKPDTASQGGSLYVVRHTNMTGVLVECGFMDNASDVSKLSNADYQYKIADAITNAVITVYGASNCYEQGEPAATTIVTPAPETPSNPSPGTDTTTPSNTPTNTDTTTPNKPSPGTDTATSNNPSKPSDPSNNPGNTFDNNNLLIFMVILSVSGVLCCKLRKVS